MLPIRDDAPRFTTPYVNYFLIAVNVLVFLFEVTLQPFSLQQFIFQFGFVPARTTAYLLGEHSIGAAAAFLPVLTAMFLHGGWLHVLGNMWFLYIFGDNVEDHFGHFRYLAVYLLSGILGSAVHTIFNPASNVPSVGASGAIAGVMGAYFVLYPRSRVLTLTPFFFFIWLPAWIMLGYWFLVQFLSGAATAMTQTAQTGGGIAVWAHVGGFVAGIVLLKLFPSRPRRYQYFG
jgi:membrane associated rhomboid family serine protease